MLLRVSHQAGQPVTSSLVLLWDILEHGGEAFLSDSSHSFVAPAGEDSYATTLSFMVSCLRRWDRSSERSGVSPRCAIGTCRKLIEHY